MSAAAPRPSATVLLLRDDPFEVLMVRRSPNGSFPSASVFPGGTVDAADAEEAWLPLLDGAEDLVPEERALRIAALRECYEEIGILLARGGVPPAACGGDFRALVAASGARLPLDTLVPFGRWITPEAFGRRWDTHFFLTRMPAGQAAVCDAVETVAVEWLAPADALAMADAGARDILLPTRMNLKRLAESGSAAAAMETARATPIFAVTPQVERRAEGLVSIIPMAAGYGITEFLLKAAELPRNGAPGAA